jgi:hypothetical protein
MRLRARRRHRNRLNESYRPPKRSRAGYARICGTPEESGHAERLYRVARRARAAAFGGLHWLHHGCDLPSVHGASATGYLSDSEFRASSARRPPDPMDRDAGGHHHRDNREQPPERVISQPPDEDRDCYTQSDLADDSSYINGHGCQRTPRSAVASVAWTRVPECTLSGMMLRTAVGLHPPVRDCADEYSNNHHRDDERPGVCGRRDHHRRPRSRRLATRPYTANDASKATPTAINTQWIPPEVITSPPNRGSPASAADTNRVFCRLESSEAATSTVRISRVERALTRLGHAWGMCPEPLASGSLVCVQRSFRGSA